MISDDPQFAQGQSVPPAVATRAPVAPPPGVTAHVGYGSRNVTGVIVGLSFLYGFMLLCLSCRAYSKLWLVGRVWWDDASLIIGTMGTTVAFIGVIWQLTGGTSGYHFYDLSMAQLLAALPTNMISNLLFVWGSSFSLIFVKASFFLSYWLLFGMIPWQRILILVLGPLLITAHIVWSGLLLHWYTPAPGTSLTQQASRQFFNVDTIWIGVYASIVSVITDCILVILPMPAIYRMNLPLHRKLSVILVISAGLFACAAAAADLWYRYSIDAGNFDLTYTVVTLLWLTVTEIMVTNCCACASAIAQTLNYLRPVARLQQRFGLAVPTYLSKSDGASTIGSFSEVRSSKSEPVMHATVTTTISQRQGSLGDALEESQGRNTRRSDTGSVPGLFAGNQGIDACRGVTTYISAPPRKRSLHFRFWAA